MRFEIAVAAILAAEHFSSSGVAGQEALPGSDIQERARRRKEAIEVISSIHPNGRQKHQPSESNRRILGQGKNFFQDRLRLFSEERHRKLSGAINQQHTKEDTPGDPISDSDSLDLGILPSTPKEKPRNRPQNKMERLRLFSEDRLQKLSVAINQKQSKKYGPGAPTSEGDSLDLGILLSTPNQELRNRPQNKMELVSGIKKSLLTMKWASDDPSHSAALDLGIITPDSTKGKLNILKGKIQKIATAENPHHQKEGSSGDLSSHSTVPDLGIISSVPRKEQRKDKIPLGSKPFGAQNGVRRVEDYFYEDYADQTNSQLLNYLCLSIGLSDYYNGVTTPSCETCEVTYIDDNDPNSAYNVKMNCANVEGDFDEFIVYTISRFQESCADICQTCSADADNFLLDLKDCTNVQSDYQSDYQSIQMDSLASTINLICMGISDYCDTCQVTFANYNDPYSAYDLEMDCRKPETDGETLTEILTGLENLCFLSFCKTSCSVVDAENLLVDMKSCSPLNVVEDSAPTIDNYGSKNPIASLFNIVCFSANAASDFYNALSDDTRPFCETCKVAYVNDTDPYSPYSIEVNCPNFPEDYDDDTNWSDFCSHDTCQSCSYDAENFRIYMNDCKAKPYLEQHFDSYFKSICETLQEETSEFSCRACGPKSTDESSFSFELDCASKVSASDSGFGSYMSKANEVCECSMFGGFQCSTCEVNPWEATINIGDCVPIVDEEQSECDYSTFSDETSFSFLYSSLCETNFAYLQDSIGNPDCVCTFDESTQTASFICQDEEFCTEMTSYCPNKPLEFCKNSHINASFTRNGTLFMKQCVNVTSPYQFSYCVSAISEPQGSPVCEMEVDGVRCNSCSFVNNEEGFRNSLNAYSYNCSNTVLGKNGLGNMSDTQLLDDTLSYFIYKSLPCSGGCDLCGVGEMNDENSGPKNEFMTNPDGRFASKVWNNGTENRCFDAQLDAMTRNQAMTNEECQIVRESAREPCGCKNPNLPPSSLKVNSSGKRISTASAALLTMAAASVVQMLLG